MWHLVKQRDFVLYLAGVRGGKVAVISYFPTEPFFLISKLTEKCSVTARERSSTMNHWALFQSKTFVLGR